MFSACVLCPSMHMYEACASVSLRMSALGSHMHTAGGVCHAHTLLHHEVGMCTPCSQGDRIVSGLRAWTAARLGPKLSPAPY